MLKFVLTGLLSGVAQPPMVIRMCPPLTTKNWNVYQPLLAMGKLGFVFRLIYSKYSYHMTIFHLGVSAHLEVMYRIGKNSFAPIKN